MFDNTPELKARKILGDTLYDELRFHFHDDLSKSGLSLDMTLAEHIKNRECSRYEVNSAFKSFRFPIFLRDSMGHKLIILLARDGYAFNHQFPTDREYSSKEVRQHMPFFGLSLYDKSGLSMGDLQYSSAVIASMQFENPKLEAQISEFSEFRQTFPQMDKNRDNFAYLYLCAFAGAPNPKVPRLSPDMAQMMGLNAKGDLDTQLWVSGGASLYDLSLKTFLEVKNPNGKDKGALLQNRYEVMDTNLASMTVLPAQILYLRGVPLEEIMQGLLNRVQTIAAHTLGQYPEYDRYVEYAIKRPFMAFPECWPELGITSADFLGKTFDEPQMSDIFLRTQFCQGIGQKFHWSDHYVRLPSILDGLNQEGADFYNPAYLRHQGYNSACKTDLSQIDGDTLKDLFDTATKLSAGAPVLIKPYKVGRNDKVGLESTLIPICDKIGVESMAQHVQSLFNARGERILLADGSYMVVKKDMAKALSIHLPEVYSRVFDLIMSEKKPKQTLVSIMLEYGRPSREHFKKLTGTNQDKVFAGDLGL